MIALDLNIQSLKESYEGNKKVRIIECNVTKEEEIKKVAEILKNEKISLFAIFNNAGIASCGDWRSSVELEMEENVLPIFNVNFFGVLRCVKHFYPFLSQGGRIINTSSFAGLLSGPLSSMCKKIKKSIFFSI